MKLLFIDGQSCYLAENEHYFLSIGYEVFTAETGQDAQNILDQHKVDCIILDTTLPDINGYHLCRQLKSKLNLPIIFLSASNDLGSGFLAGADDYLTKPHCLHELEIRILVRSRPYIAPPKHKSWLENPPLKVDIYGRVVTIEDQIVGLIGMEFKILVFLMSQPNVVFSQRDIYRSVWKQLDLDNSHTVQVHIARMRKKMGKLFPTHSFIQTVWGYGYKFVPY